MNDQERASRNKLDTLAAVCATHLALEDRLYVFHTLIHDDKACRRFCVLLSSHGGIRYSMPDAAALVLRLVKRAAAEREAQ
ncbi:MAG TPA: hypothetical protein VJO33_02415 [Gemmatimonadaceae bacterium]|nr:hypothetical protein [Gemmatimonadaceae bacterium]